VGHQLNAPQVVTVKKPFFAGSKKWQDYFQKKRHFPVE